MTTQTMPRNGQMEETELADGEILEQAIENTKTGFDRREAAFMEAQLDTAYKRRRSLKQFIMTATTYATQDQETAAACSYSLPRRNADGKTQAISGPSVRLAEICALAWGNMHTESRIVEIGEEYVKVAAVCWDMESNNRMGQEAARRIVKKNGQRYSDDMIIMTANAAISIVLRNVVFRIIPKALVEQIRAKAVAVAKGDAASIKKRRDEAVAHWKKQGVSQERLLAGLGKAGIEDIDAEDIAIMLGYWTAVKDKEATIDDCFPPLETKTQSLADKVKGKKADEQPKQDESSDASATISQATLDAIQEQQTIRGQSLADVRGQAKKRFKVEVLTEMNEQQGGEILAWLLSLPEARQPGED